MSSSPTAPPLRFRLLDRRREAAYRVFDLRSDLRRHPRHGTLHRYQVLRCPDWVNVIARDERGRFVLVRQWRAGTDQITLEIPGGMADPGEDALATARRELLEETGFGGGRARLLGEVRPNPALMTNRCATVLVEDCREVAEPTPDGGEQIEVLLLDPVEMGRALRDGRIDHALVMAAFTHYLLRGGGFAAGTGPG